jgi:hypothetical protein
MDPHWFGSLVHIWFRIAVKSWIRIRIETKADPNRWYLHLYHSILPKNAFP